MKVFVYDKKESKCLNVITEVTVCSEVKEYNQLLICTKKRYLHIQYKARKNANLSELGDIYD